MKTLLIPGRRPARRQDTLRDPLTQLATRSLLLDRVRHAVDAQARQGGVVALLFVDIPGFRALNDQRGPTFGDELLVAIARRLGECLRSVDTLARTAGDEFGILLAGLADDEGGLDAAHRVIDAMAEPFALHGEAVTVCAKAGLALSGGGLPPDELVRHAGVALEEAHDGGARLVVHDAVLYREALDHLEVKSQLVGAIREGDLSVHYQPIVDLATGAVRSVEALSRWELADGTWRDPELFIGVAERMNQVMAIDHHALRHACTEAAGWVATVGSDAPTVAVNVSSQTLEASNLPELVRDALGDAGLPAERLTLEVTERCLMSRGSRAPGNLADLSALGVSVALDDFGTGHSSLTHLDTLPVDQLKIDRSFVARLPAGGAERIVRAVVAVGTSLGIDVVAEGIERRAQQDAVVGLGCALGQGYLFARPGPGQAVSEMLRRPAAAAP